MKIAVLYICVGKYDIFWKDFYLSCEKYFLNHHEKEYFVFTDAERIFHEDKDPHIHKLYEEFKPWPYPTLMRFKMFHRLKEVLSDFDYIFFMNANVKFVTEIKDEEVLPSGSDKLITVIHPGFANKKRWEYTYDRNPKSRAYVRRKEGNVYVMGSLNGGCAAEYLKMIETLKNNTDEDLTEGIIALFHDESHLNRYVIGRNDVRFLPPVYIWPEHWKADTEPRIVLRNKSDYLDYFDMRGEKQTATKFPNYYKILRYKLRLFADYLMAR